MELQKLLSSESDNRLDLNEVKLVDQDAVTFLASREAGGLKLRNCPAYIAEWIKQHGKSVKGRCHCFRPSPPSFPSADSCERTAIRTNPEIRVAAGVLFASHF
jgi:hypothetical protein